jgi:hypothetical protein
MHNKDKEDTEKLIATMNALAKKLKDTLDTSSNSHARITAKIDELQDTIAEEIDFLQDALTRLPRSPTTTASPPP